MAIFIFKKESTRDLLIIHMVTPYEEYISNHPLNTTSKTIIEINPIEYMRSKPVARAVVGLTQAGVAFNMEALAETDAQHVTGMSLSELDASSPKAYVMIRWLYGNLGLLKIGWSFFLLAVTLTGYRKGEKWAWYTLWLAPVQLVGAGIFNWVFFGDFSEMYQWFPITTISLIGLLLPYRKFFPK